MFQIKTLIAICLAALGFSAAAQVPQPPEIAARAYLLVDVTANQTLAAKAIDASVEPGALTKLMTAYLVFDALQAKKIDLTQVLPISERAWRMPGPRMFVNSNMQVPVDDLIRGMLVQSGNDAAMALAEGIGGTAEQFVQMMNDQAKSLGMKDTRFKNPEGQAEAGHATTARDLGILAARLLSDFPQYMGYHGIKQYRYPGTPASNETNRNLLLFRDPSVDGLKTGHTEASGYCMAATAKRFFPNLVTPVALPGTAAATGERRLLAIVMGAENENSRASESQKLLNWGYTAFEAVKLFEANQPVITPVVWKGASSTVKLGRTQSLIVAVPSGWARKINTQILRNDPILAPVTKNQHMATLHVTAGESWSVDVPLLALEGVEQAGILGRAWDAIRLWVR